MGPRERVDRDDQERIERGDPTEVVVRDEAQRASQLLQRARELLGRPGENRRAPVGSELAALREVARQRAADEIERGRRESVGQEEDECEPRGRLPPSGADEPGGSSLRSRPRVTTTTQRAGRTPTVKASGTSSSDTARRGIGAAASAQRRSRAAWSSGSSAREENVAPLSVSALRNGPSAATTSTNGTIDASATAKALSRAQRTAKKIT